VAESGRTATGRIAHPGPPWRPTGHRGARSDARPGRPQELSRGALILDRAPVGADEGNGAFFRPDGEPRAGHLAGGTHHGRAGWLKSGPLHAGWPRALILEAVWLVIEVAVEEGQPPRASIRSSVDAIGSIIEPSSLGQMGTGPRTFGRKSNDQNAKGARGSGPLAPSGEP
jgi:hypothetical protein